MLSKDPSVFESDPPAGGLEDRARRRALKLIRAVALTGLGICTATGAVAWIGFFLFSADRPLARELSCLPPDAFARRARARAGDIGLRPIPELRLVLAAGEARELVCFAADRQDGATAVPTVPDEAGYPPALTTLFVRADESDAALVPQ